MKKLFATLTALLLALLALMPACAETKYYDFSLFEISEGDITYRSYNNIGLTFRLYDDGSLKSYGLKVGEDKEDPAVRWQISEDRKTVYLTIGETEYALDFENNIMTLTAGERKLVFRQKHQAEEAAQQPAEYQTLTYPDISGYVAKACPASEEHWMERAMCCTMDGNVRYSFTTEYGPFQYVVNSLNGDILEREEPDIDAVREQEGSREKLTSDEIYEYVFKICPVERSSAEKIARQSDADGNWNITITTVFGDFFYKVDAYTGEILDKEEPDVDALRAEGVTEPITSEQAMEIAEKDCPLDYNLITSRKVSKAENTITVTLGCTAGDFVYEIDRMTGEILRKTEPDISALQAEVASHALTDTGEGFAIAEAAFPLDADKITARKVSKSGDIWTYTLGTVYGDFVYQIDSISGTIVGKDEPDVEAARSQEGFREPLPQDEVMEIAFGACPVKKENISSRGLSHGEDNNWKITLGTAQGDYVYFIDGFTGEILDSVTPGEEAPAQDEDPFGAAIDAAFAAMENFDYKAEDIRVAQKKVGGQDVIVVTFNWQGKPYEFTYSLAERKLITD